MCTDSERNHLEIDASGSQPILIKDQYSKHCQYNKPFDSLSTKSYKPAISADFNVLKKLRLKSLPVHDSVNVCLSDVHVVTVAIRS